MHRALSKYGCYLPATLLKGENVIGLLRRKRENQYIAPGEMRAYQAKKIREIFHHAKQHSQFYKDHFSSLEIPSVADAKELTDWFGQVPTLSKQDLIERAACLRTHTSTRTSTKTTGGSTGEPVLLSKNSTALANERAATWRAYEWAGIKIGDKQMRFWGIPLMQQDKWKARLTDIVANRRRISAFALATADLDRYHTLLLRYQPAYLYGYASVIRIFAEHIEEKGLSVPASLKSVITTSEVLTDNARKQIETTFGVQVFNEYGCGEVGSIAHECSAGSMHVMADNVYLELDLKDGQKTGEIIVTDLHNTEMPLIRYRLGDFASWGDSSCSCGVTLPILEGVHGRAYDIIRTSDGRELHPEAVMYIFEKLQSDTGAFKHFQAIQTSLDHYQINIVPAASWTPEIEESLEALMKRHIDRQAKLTISAVDSISREKSGKLRVVKSLLNAGSVC